MKPKKTFVLLFAVLAGLAGCGVQTPKADIESVKLVNATFDKISASLNLRVENPNSFDIHIREVRYKLFSNNKMIIEDKTTKKIALPAKESTKVELPIGFSTMKVADAGLEALTKGKVDYRAEAVIVVELPVGPVEIPVTKVGKLSF